MRKRSNIDVTGKEFKIIFLHHSTGGLIYNGGKRVFKITENYQLQKPYVEKWFENFNKQNATNYHITKQAFPKKETYGWNNYPFDYYNIWVKNAGEKPYLEEPTLEILTKKYDMIIFKHCFPVSDINEDTGRPDINSPEKRLENYKLQYQAIKQKLKEFPNTKFLVWTGAARVKAKISEEKALRAQLFFDWVKNEWDEPDDNIFIFDFYGLETNGNLYLKPEYTSDPNDSHPNKALAKIASPLLCQRIIEVIEKNK